MPKTIRILSIDGGGIRGIIPATVLSAILGDRRAAEVFHLIAGTSTGGIIASGLSKPDPLSPKDMVALYRDHGTEIFGRPLVWRFPGANLIEEKYDSEALEHYLGEALGNARLSQVGDVDLLVPSYAIELPRPRSNGETRAPMFFASWRARGEDLPAGATSDEYDFHLRDVCRATSAAPTYFEPAEIRNIKGEPFGMIDGGVFANNPAMCALAAAYRRFGHEHDYLVVSLGTGFLQRPIPLAEAKGWGMIGWARPVLSVLMDGNSDTVCYQLDQVLDREGEPERHFRFDIPLGVKRTERNAVNDDFDDASRENIEALLRKAKDLVRKEEARIRLVAARLEGVKDDLGA